MACGCGSAGTYGSRTTTVTPPCDPDAGYIWDKCKEAGVSYFSFGEFIDNPERKEAAFAYMNWWLSGWPGAFIARQGYYISTSRLSRAYLSAAEWDYWYDGKPAQVDLRNTQGDVAVAAGQVRNGGSYEQRFSNIAVWNTVMPTYEYSLQRWAEFLAA